MKRPTARKTGRPGAKPFQLAVGREFDVDPVPRIEATARSFLARIVALSAVVAVGVTGTLGLVTGNYAPVEIVWAVAGPLVGAIMTYYFGTGWKQSE